MAARDDELHLEIGYFFLADARESGMVIERLALAYSGYCRSIGVTDSRLVLEDVEVSSLIARFKAVVDVVGAAIVVAEYRDLLEPFVQQVGVAVTILKDATGGDVPPAMRRFLRAFVSPLQKGRAARARLMIKGSNGAVIDLQAEDGDLIAKALAETPISRLLALDEAQPASASPRTNFIKSDFAHLIHDRGDLWHAQPAEFDGLMVPVDEAWVSRHKLEPGVRYRATGKVRLRNGLPHRFVVARYESINPAKRGAII